MPQWVCAGTDKVPINPRTGQAADPMNPSTWCSFEDACNSGKPHIGFVLSTVDPYCIIDLDDKEDRPATPEQRARFEAIINTIDSYTEISQSGRGIHIVCKGSIPAGVKRDNVEVYSWGRYMIFTGNVLKNAPITDQQATISRMYDEMKSDNGLSDLEWVEPLVSDLEVWETGMRASNADKFSGLWNGAWQQFSEYETEGQSAADYALLSMLCFYTRSNEQVIRMFRTSGLGQRKKAQRDDYLIRSIRRIRSVQNAPLVDLSNLRFPTITPTPAPIKLECSAPAVAQVPTYNGELRLPPGLVGELAQYCFQSSLRPVWHVSLGAAIALTAGIAGRAYNVSSSGLNHYVILVAGTGRGKEDAQRFVDRVMASVAYQAPSSDRFIGPGRFASGEALIRILDDRPCFLSVLGEFGITLQSMTDRNAQPAMVMLKKVLLDLYAKSGFQSVLRPSVYSDRDKNTKLVQAPNVSILGEGSTETFYNGLEQTHILDGLIPRFTIINYDGPRVSRNPHAFGPPGLQLSDKVATLCMVCQACEASVACAPVATEQAAHNLLDAFDRKCDDLINHASNQAEAELWNRAHLKALKLAALVAVGCDPHNPIVTAQIADWALWFTEWEVGQMTQRFARGEVGQGDHRQEQDLRKVIEEYYKMTPYKRAGYGIPKALAEHGNVFPLSHLNRRLRLLSSFKHDKRGPHAAISALLDTLTKDGTLAKVPTDQAFGKFGTRAVIYVLGESWGFDSE